MLPLTVSSILYICFAACLSLSRSDHVMNMVEGSSTCTPQFLYWRWSCVFHMPLLLCWPCLLEAFGMCYFNITKMLMGSAHHCCIQFCTPSNPPCSLSQCPAMYNLFCHLPFLDTLGMCCFAQTMSWIWFKALPRAHPSSSIDFGAALFA